jgi:hypothetical protein
MLCGEGDPVRTSIVFCLTAALLRQCADMASGAALILYLSYLNAHGRPISSTTVGFIGTGFYLLSIFLPPVFGRLSDRLGRKPFIVVGLAVGLVVVQFYPSTTLPFSFFLLLSLEGIGNAVESPATLGYFGDVTVAVPSLRGRIMGLYEIVTMASVGVGYLLGGILWDNFGREGFRILSGIYLLGIFCVVFGLRHVPPVTSSSKKTLARGWWHARWLILVAPAILAASAIIGAWTAQAPFLAASQIQGSGQRLIGGYSGTAIGLVLLALAGIFGLGAYTWGAASSRIRQSYILAISLFGAVTLLAALYRWNNLNPDSVGVLSSPKQVFLMFVLAGSVFAASGFTPTLLIFLANSAEECAWGRGLVMGLYSTLLGLGRVAGSWLSGPAAEAGGFNGLIILTLILVTVAGLAFAAAMASESASRAKTQSDAA